MKVVLVSVCLFLLGLDICSAIDGSTDDGIIDIDRNDRDVRDKRYVSYIIKNELTPRMTAFAEALAKSAVSYYSRNSDMARYIRGRFDSRYGKHWQCIVGKSFGFSIYKKSKNYIFFRSGSYYVTLFRSV